MGNIANLGGWKNRGKSISISDGNEIYVGTRKECAMFLNVAPQTISGLVNGRYKTCKGWKLIINEA